MMSDLWSLSFVLTEFEFLAGGRIDRVSGQIRAEVGHQSAMAPLLFNRLLVFGAADLALRFPSQALARPVLAQGHEIEPFLRQLMPRTVSCQLASPEVARLVAAIVRADRLHGFPSMASQGAVAKQLGYGVTTLRRYLAAEGTSFRLIREDVYDELETRWLIEGEAVETIADRLGYSDAFAFRRSFRRRHDCSPSAYRREIARIAPDL